MRKTAPVVVTLTTLLGAALTLASLPGCKARSGKEEKPMGSLVKLPDIRERLSK